MFNKNLMRTFSSFSNLSNSLIVKYPITVLTDATRSVAVKIDISKLDTDSFDEFGLYEKLNKFVNIFNIFEDPTVSLQDNIFTISDSSGKKTTFITDDVSLLTAYDLTPGIFDKIKGANSVADFQLSVSDIKALKDAQRIFSDLDKVKFSGNENGIEVSLDAPSKFNAQNNTFTLTKNIEVKKNFNLYILFEVLTKLPLINYNIHIKYNENKNIFRFYITCEDLDYIEILCSPTID